MVIYILPGGKGESMRVLDAEAMEVNGAKVAIDRNG